MGPREHPLSVWNRTEVNLVYSLKYSIWDLPNGVFGGSQDLQIDGSEGPESDPRVLKWVTLSHSRISLDQLRASRITSIHTTRIQGPQRGHLSLWD